MDIGVPADKEFTGERIHSFPSISTSKFQDEGSGNNEWGNNDFFKPTEDEVKVELFLNNSWKQCLVSVSLQSNRFSF